MKERLKNNKGRFAVEMVKWGITVGTTLLLSVLLLPTFFAILSDEGPIRNIINQEADLVSNGKNNQAVSLFAEDAYVRDAAGGNTNLEVIWNGKNEITQRYANLPEFTIIQHSAIEITISSDKNYARAVADTIGAYKINGTITKISSNRGEKWTFDKIDGEWKITSFTYNLP